MALWTSDRPLSVRSETGKSILWIRAHLNYAGNDCLPWPYGKDEDGYGQLGYDGLTWRAPTLMCTLAHGPRPARGYEAAHSCGSGRKGCTNPRHLSWKTRKENVADMMRHGTAYVQTRREQYKLDEEKVAQILALKGVKSQRQIAAMFDISNRTVSKIHLGNAWKDGKRQKPGFKPGDPRNIGWRTNALRRRPRLTRDYVP